MSHLRALGLLAALGMVCVLTHGRGIPSQETLSADLARLEELRAIFFETQARGDQFGDVFWRASRHLADERGSAIIDAVMVDSERWQGEEGLIFVPLVSLLSREEATERLTEYRDGPDERLRIWAREFLVEFEASDVQEAVEKYRAEQAEGGNG